MAKVNKVALEEALEQLSQAGFIAGWQARPLGMYAISMLDGEVLRPDTKETAMWVQGAWYGVKAHIVTTAVESATSIDHDQIAGILNVLDECDVLQSWEIDSDGDYALTFPDGTGHFVEPTDMTAYATGALHALNGIRLQNEQERR